MAIAGPFDRPIPGQSLTTELGNSPWESPPQMAEIEDVTKYYIERLADQEVIDDFAAMIQAGAKLEPIVESTYLQGVMRGLHTLDAGLLVAPILHQFLKAAIEGQGVTVPSEDMQAKAEKAEMNRFMLLATAYLDRDDVEQDAGTQMLQEMVDTQEEAPVEEEEKPQQGLMAKG
jgi:hypothetical protein